MENAKNISGQFLNANDVAAGDPFAFGYSVAINGNTVIVGAPADGHAGVGSGSAYLFDATTGSQLFRLTASDASAEDNFGYSVAIDGNTAIVGAAFDDDAGTFSGSAYLFDVTTGSELVKLTANDGSSLDYFGWSVGISGSTAIVGVPFDDDAGQWSGSAYLFTPEPNSLLLAALACLALLAWRKPRRSGFA